jgi:RNase P subunit RPR2
LLPEESMEFICQHCDDVARGAKYRVISEENGLVFLNMVVCRSCHEQAKQLGLHAEQITPTDEARSRHSEMARAESLTAH